MYEDLPFYFYPKDWLSNGSVRVLTPAARGTLIDLICWLEVDKEGVFKKRITNETELAGFLRCDPKIVEELIHSRLLWHDMNGWTVFL